jgi:DNA gyrase inhibitor GyrI
MTTPVLFETSAQNRMSFFMPAATRARGTPQPESSDVELDQQPGGEFAVVRFSGPMRQAAERHAVEELRALLEAADLESNGEPLIAYYDSPMIPGPFRRNEVMIPITSARR